MDESYDDDEVLRNQVLRKQLGDIPLGELQKLKDKMGLKLYNEAVFGSGEHKSDQVLEGDSEDEIDKKDKIKNKTKSESKNFKVKQISSEPLEISSKKRKQNPRTVVNVEKRKIRDPRFDDLSGKYNEKCYKSSYSFLEDMQKNEFENVCKQLKKEKDESKKKEIHQLLTRLKQQNKDKKLQEKQKQKRIERKKSEKVLIKQGEKPFYLKKSEQQKLNLMEKYKELKSSGQLDKYMTKKRKRNAAKEKKKLPNMNH